MKNKRFNIKSIMIYAFPFFGFILCLFSKETSAVAKNAIYLCLDIVIPSLFPFFVLSRIIVPYISDFPCPKFLKSIIEKFFCLPYYSIFIILLGFISGYPNGAKMARDMFDHGLLDSRQAAKILPMANYCSPLFIIGTIGSGLFKSVRLGVFLLLIHWISGLISAFIIGKIADYSDSSMKEERNHNTRNSNKEASRVFMKNNIQPVNLLTLLPASIEDAAILCIKVSGYIVFFAVISELLSLLGVFSLISGLFGILIARSSQAAGFSEFIAVLLKGFMEITSGAQAIYSLNGLQLNIQLAAISTIFGFAGFSVHTQIMGIMKGAKSRYRIFFLGKLLHGIIAGATTLLAIYIMPMAVQTSGMENISSVDLLWIRPMVIGVLLVSLVIAPYRTILNEKK